MQPKIVIGVPTGEFARQAKFYDYLAMLDKPEGTFTSSSHGQSPATNRNIIIEQALQLEATHVFFVDDDVLIPRDALKKLLAHDKDIVSGLYLQRNFPHAPIAFNVSLNDGKCRYKFLNNKETGLVEVVNFGLGCCLIKTDVFRNIPKPWITIGQLNAQEWNDDIAFFNRCTQAGYHLFLDLDVRCGHMATATVWPEYKDGQWLTVYDTQGSGNAAFFAATPQSVYGNDEYERRLQAQKEAGYVVKDLSDGGIRRDS